MLLLFLCMFIIKSTPRQIEQYSLYSVTAFNAHERKVLYDMYLQQDTIIFLNGITNNAAMPMDIVVNGCCTVEFEMKLQDKYIEYSNVDNYLIQSELNNIHQFCKISSNPDITESFLSYDQIVKWVHSKCKKHTALQKIDMGSTYEKREMMLVKLSSGENKPAVFILGGEQGRDWMSTAIVLNFLNTLLENPQDVLLATYDFYIMPVFNPDGYEFCMKEDRLWNKNRKSFFPLKKCPSNQIAVGVDIDRNWFLSKARPYPDAECLSVYLGNRCLTEEETNALSIFLNSIATNLLAFINLRGFENLVTVPYAETDKYADNHAILMEMLLFSTAKLKQVFNVTYKFSNTAHSFFNFSGNAADWVKYRLNVPIVYTMYMRKEPFITHHTEHIIPLSNQFRFMAEEMLMLGSHIYGPLFSKKTCMTGNSSIVVLFNIFLSLTWF